MRAPATTMGVPARTSAAAAPDGRRAATLLARAAGLWLTVALLGQALFAFYIVGLYGRSAAAGNFAAWDRRMPRGWVPGDRLGNAAIASHLLLAVVILVGGALQLVPAVRRRAPGVHRWTGRAYLVAALGASVAGLYLVWVRGTVGTLGQHLGVTLNALLIIAFAGLAWQTARRRAFAAHRRWALRLFLAANGVWFFRVGLMLWLLAWRRPVGFDPDAFAGPALVALTFGQTLVPLGILEVYLAAHERGGARARLAVAAGLAVLAAATGTGVVGAAAGMWLPALVGR